MKVLSVDPGYARLGIAVLESNKNGKEQLLYSDCIETSNDDSFEERLSTIGKELEKVIKKYSPDTFASESIFFTTNQKTALLVAGSRGILLYIANNHKIPVYEYTPLQVKIAVTGYGKSDKKQVTEMVKRLIKIEKDIVLDDEFDAIAIGLTCLATEKTKSQ